MKHWSWLAITILWAGAAGAYPNADRAPVLLDQPDKSILEREWIATTSYYYNQLKVIPQTAIIPAAPRREPGAAAGQPTLADTQSITFGLQFDLNYDGKLDEFLSFPRPPLLGSAFSPERNDSSKISPGIYSLALPSMSPTGNLDGNYQLWAECLGASQGLFIEDVSARARGDSGLVAQAEWSDRSSKDPSKPTLPAEQSARLPNAPVFWLALLLGLPLLFKYARARRLHAAA